MQLDQIHAYWMGPFEEWALARLGAPGLARRVDLNPLPHFVALRSACAGTTAHGRRRQTG